MSRIDRASRTIAATPAPIYDALLDREALEAWLPPGIGQAVHEEGIAPSLANLAAYAEGGE
ncbi:hypothetical protein AB0H28_12500 [Micromonospora sp. NPDC050980]|uniref:hypothetical protein n=1 Tax=Micromonospora sp. NPDC050980 TaxID=3155161 RepID=UPI0033E16D51